MMVALGLGPGDAATAVARTSTDGGSASMLAAEGRIQTFDAIIGAGSAALHVHSSELPSSSISVEVLACVPGPVLLSAVLGSVWWVAGRGGSVSM